MLHAGIYDDGYFWISKAMLQIWKFSSEVAVAARLQAMLGWIVVFGRDGDYQ